MAVSRVHVAPCAFVSQTPKEQHMNDRNQEGTSKPTESEREAWRRVRAVADAELARLDAVATAPSAAPPLVYMTYDEYAAHRHVSASTVKRWVKRRMPVERRGATVRIPVAAADAWKDPTEGDPEADEREGAIAAARGAVRR
jgi:hypothetical protein